MMQNNFTNKRTSLPVQHAFAGNFNLLDELKLQAQTPSGMPQLN
jgi:hypothetical protein